MIDLPQPQSGEDAPASPLMMFVLATLSSMMAPTLDLQLARLAAREAIDTYRSRGQHELLTIGQIVAFAVAALDTLRLSMPGEVPLSMKARLRGKANALNRSSCECVRLLEKGRVCEQVETLPESSARVPAAGGLLSTLRGAFSEQSVDPGPTPATTNHKTCAMTMGNACTATVANASVAIPDIETAQPLTGLDWAEAMQCVAATLQTETVIASPEQREIDAMWIEALNGVGTELLQGQRLSHDSGGTPSRLAATLRPGNSPTRFGKSKRKRDRAMRRLN